MVAAAAALLLLGSAAVLVPLAPALHSQWTGVATYSHGYLLLGMASWLAYRSWSARPVARIAPDWWYLFPLTALLGLLVLMEFLFLNVPRLYLLPLMIVSAVGFVFGRGAASRLFWPMMLMYCALPIWAVLNEPLRTLTTSVVSSMLAMTGIPAFIEGNFVNLPAGTFEVAEECSGLRYLVVGTTLGLFYALAFLSAWRERALLLASTVGVSVVANWIRVYTIVVAGHLTDMQHYLVRVEHVRFGWVLFFLLLVPVVWLGRRLERPDRDVAAPGRRVVEGRAVVVAGTVAAAALLLSRLVSVELISGERESPATAVAAAHGSEEQLPSRDWSPLFVNALEKTSTDVRGLPDVEIYWAIYPRQNSDHRLIRFENGFVPAAWQGIARRVETLQVAGDSLDVIEFEGYLAGQRRLVYGWYWVAGRPAAGALEAKLLELIGLADGRRDAVAVAVSAECGTDCVAARERLTAYVQSSIDTLKWHPEGKL